ncbi:spermidine synthase [Granulicoccus sp. GXG6511]|uniref:spermidine synthase n=1 Tax=Granulicoccus sp. GXG6511 TaxID=3381351 RepID=UPI003D7EDC03
MNRVVPDPEQPGAWYVRINGTDHSWIDPEDPTRLEFDYMQRIADVVDAHAPAGERLRVLHIGGAGMTLPRYVAATRPTSAQIVLEPDEELTAEVRRTVPLPRNSGIKVRPIDGRAGVAAIRDDWNADVVIMDAFAGASVPAELTTLEFFTDLRRVLAPVGVVLLNVTDKSPFVYARRVLAGLAEVFPELMLSAEPATLKGRRFGNILLAGSAMALPLAALSRKAAGSVFPYRVLHGPHLARFGSGGVPFTDRDAAPSPEPPGGPAFFR